jgi:hypothetical protein
VCVCVCIVYELGTLADLSKQGKKKQAAPTGLCPLYQVVVSLSELVFLIDRPCQAATRPVKARKEETN